MMKGESGVVDFVLITENAEGNKLIRVRMRDQRIPEIGRILKLMVDAFL